MFVNGGFFLHGHWAWGVAEWLEAIASAGFGGEAVHWGALIRQSAWVCDVIRAAADGASIPRINEVEN